MLCFDSDRLYSPMSPKRSVSRRSVKRITQASLLVAAILLMFMFGRNLHWSSWAPTDPRSMDIIKSLCDNQAHFSTDSILENGAAPSYLRAKTVPDQAIPIETWQSLPVKGAFYMLVRNENIQETRSAMRSVEDRFNHKHKYPWVLLNNQDFSPAFRKYITKVTDAPIFLGKIDLDAWNHPSWINVKLAEEKMEMMHAMGLYKGASASFRHMLR